MHNWPKINPLPTFATFKQMFYLQIYTKRHKLKPPSFFHDVIYEWSLGITLFQSHYVCYFLKL